jgi:hypothetical protein
MNISMGDIYSIAANNAAKTERSPLFTYDGNLADRSGLAEQREQQISISMPALELASAIHPAERNHASQSGTLQTMTGPGGDNRGDAHG